MNPSLWENTRNNHAYGLFEVCEGIYQVRGYDMANLTVEKGDTGWIVFDATMCVETAQAGIPVESFYAPYVEETIVIPSITLLSGDGVMQIDSEGEQYESSSIIVTVDPGQTFGEALSLEEITDATLDGKTFTGWTVYDVAAVEAAETLVEEEGVLCYEVFKGWYMILREYTICQERISTQELAELICGTTDHVVVANFK